jgi:hypothetical protein
VGFKRLAIITPKSIIKHAATGASYPIANELRLNVGLNEIIREVEIASQATFVLAIFFVRK